MEIIRDQAGHPPLPLPSILNLRSKIIYMDSLKNDNKKYIYTYLALWILFTGLLAAPDDSIWHMYLSNDAFNQLSSQDFVRFLPIALAYVLTARLLPTELKEILVFGRLRERLPGCRAFSHFAHTDVRIDKSVLEARYGPLPSDGSDQNALWYKIYKKHQGDPGVSDAHRDYLLFRDLAGITFLVLCLLSPLLIILGTITIETAVSLAAGAFVLMLLLGTSARNSANRFVQNVLAADSAAPSL